jgi:tetratricopeptide (TPR) repeat protein
MVLADLHTIAGSKKEAARIYAELAKEDPGRPEIEESLAYLAWQSGDPAMAREHFSKALDDNTKNAQMCYHYAALEHEAGSSERAMKALRRALEIKPDYREARLQLGLTLLGAQRYAEALSELVQVKSVSSEEAAYYFCALAFTDLKAGSVLEARKNADFARKWAKTPEQTEQATSLLRYLDVLNEPQKPAMATSGLAVPAAPAEQTEPPSLVHRPISRIEGKAKKLICAGKSAWFVVQTDAGEMTFQIADPTLVTIKHSGEVTHEFNCGIQSGYHVVVEFDSKASVSEGSAGLVRTLEF